MSAQESQGTGRAFAADESILPGFFRDGLRRLYFCSHLPKKDSSISGAVLICNSFGHEYERSHRSLRQLAMRLARSGCLVMRFDYFGTGDSPGESEQVSLQQMQTDIDDAIDACLRASGVESLTLIGVRIGATLAAQAASRRNDIDSMVLYAPVLDGKRLLQQWLQHQMEYDRNLGRAPRQVLSENVLGYPLIAELRTEIERPFRIDVPAPQLKRALVISDELDDVDAIGKLADRLARNGAVVTTEPAGIPGIWCREPDEAIVPFKFLQRIVKWTRECAE